MSRIFQFRIRRFQPEKSIGYSGVARQTMRLAIGVGSEMRDGTFAGM